MARIQIVDTIIEKAGKLLMLKRAFEPKGKLDFLGGFVDQNESIERAAIREVCEESGLDVILTHKLGTYDYYDRGKKTAHVFIGEIVSGKTQNSTEGELIWVDPATIQVEDLAFPQVHSRVLQDFLTFKKSSNGD